jgi:uncharacterized protein
MNEQIKNLIQLQKLDSKVVHLQRRKERLPQEKENEEIVYQDLKNQLNQLGEELKRLKIRRNEKEVDLQAKEEQVKKLQLQLYQVKDNKSYSALQSEIKSIEADNSIIEEEVLNLLDEVEEKEQQASKKKEELDQNKQQMDKRLAEIDKEASDLNEKINELKKEREKFLSLIEDSVLVLYEKILRNKRDSLAIVPIRGGSCQGCFITLVPQILNEAKIGNRIVTCQNCSRILYSEE